MVGTCLKPIARFKISGSICKIEPALNLVFENPREYKKQQGSPCRAGSVCSSRNKIQYCKKLRRKRPVLCLIPIHKFTFKFLKKYEVKYDEKYLFGWIE